MSKAIFMGDNYYTWLGMKDILRGTSIYYGMQYYAASLPPSSLPVVQNNDYLIIHPEQTDILKYASIVRRLSSRSSLMLFVLTDVETFAVFQTICGMQMHFLDRTLSLDALHRRVTQLINCKNTSVNRPLDNAMSVNEFNVMMMYSRGWSLTRIASIAHKSEKTIGAYKSNISKKLGHSNIHLKYMLSNYL